MISLIPLSGILILLYWIRYFVLKKDLPITVPILFTCLFLPKLNLLKVSGLSTAGIRTDDLLALVLLVIAVRDRHTYMNRHVKRGILVLIVLSAVNLLSVFIGRMNGYENQIMFSILSVIRKFEYFAFVSVGIYLVRKLKRPYKVFMDEFTLMCVMHVLLAVLQVIGKGTYVVSGSDAGNFFAGLAVSTFNGYYEYGQFLCFACAIFICDYLKTRNPYSLIMLPVSLVMVYLSGSRSSLVVALLLIAIAVYFPIRNRASKPVLVMGGFGILGVLFVAMIFISGMIGLDQIGRFGTIVPEEFFSSWGKLISKGSLADYLDAQSRGIHEFDAMQQMGITKEISDWSAAARIYKWGAVLDGFRMYPLLGYGTGVTHTMDGNYVKLLAETGIVGTVLWLGFYGYFMAAVMKVRHWSNLAKPVLLMMLSILINAVMLDMFEASKPMEMLWLLTGAVLAYAEMERTKTCQP